MNIVVLSRSASLYSTNSIVQAARDRFHFVRVVDHMACELIIDKDELQISWNNQILRHVDAVIPRIGTSATRYGASVIRQFEAMGVYTALSSEALINSRNKLTSLQKLAAHGVRVPRTGISNNSHTYSELLDSVCDPPYIIKMISGTQGMGVLLSENKRNAQGILESFSKMNKNVMIQEFIPESNGADVRVFVVNGQVVGAMKRQAQPGEFRSNLHLGGYSFEIELTEEEEKTALKAVEILGLSIAGVDLLQSDRGPMVLEVNASPGLEGIEQTTQKDIAGEIIEFVQMGAKDYRRKKRANEAG